MIKFVPALGSIIVGPGTAYCVSASVFGGLRPVPISWDARVLTAATRTPSDTTATGSCCGVIISGYNFGLSYPRYFF